jgi:signal transduction histidine kinase
MDRFRRLGLQKRIMLYVAAGLVLLFGVLAFVGLASIDEATQLVYQERLTTAHTTAGILERDLATAAARARKAATAASGSEPAAGMASNLLDDFADPDEFPFFRVSGVWVVDGRGEPLDSAGWPAPPPQPGAVERSVLSALGGDYAVLRALGPVPGQLPFAAVAVRLGDQPGVGAVIVHTVSLNSRQSYVPAVHGRPGFAEASPPPSATAAYHLEVVGPDGIAVLGIGEDEEPGRPSTHFPAIQSLMAEQAAAALLHEPAAGQTFEPHVMAVVPLRRSPFYVVIEQPVDVALALPLQLRQRLLGLTALGFLATLLVAWITTRHVVKPTEELTAAAQRMAGGDLSSPIQVEAEDEVATLAESLETMRQRLQAAYAEVEHTNRELEGRVAERTARLGQLLRTTITAQEEERYRLARELHDETAQTLAALSIALDRARDSLDGGPPALERIQEARGIAERLLAETRRLILGLRPALLDDLGLVPAIRWHCEHTFDAEGVAVSIEAETLSKRLPSHVEMALFRIVQEAVNNAYRHADARHVWVRLDMDDGLVRVVVRDDGHGFDVERVLGASGPSSSVGLAGMQERVAILNGTLKIHSASGGTEVVVHVPQGSGEG